MDLVDIFCRSHLSPHRTDSMFLKLCLQPAFGKLLQNRLVIYLYHAAGIPDS